MDISDFIPYYPEIYDYDTIISEEKQFEENIFKLKEFNELKLDQDIKKNSEKKIGFLKHQHFISRYLSNITKYDKLLLFHSPGTGKTGASIGLIENIRRLNDIDDINIKKIKGAIIIAKNTDLLQNYKNELVFKFTKNKYIPKNYPNLSDDVKQRRINKMVKQFYRFETMQTFSDNIAKYNNKQLENIYSDYIFVIDEVHNFPFVEKEKQKQINVIKYSKMYKEFSRLFDNTKNCKILLMTGTPMKDTVDELPYIMNLLLPVNNKFDVSKNFTKNFFDVDNKGVIIKFKTGKEQEFKNKIKGKISYLKTSYKNNIPKKYIGETNIFGLQTFSVDVCKMINFQKEKYNIIYNEDIQTDKKSSFRMNSRQASLFVFPDGSVGAKGFDKYVKNKKFKLTEKNNPIVNEITKNGEDHENMLNNLKKFSVKYYKVIKRILDSYNKKEKSFVYCEFVHGSGIILFSYLLDLFGFSNSKISSFENITKEPRYILITSSKYINSTDISKSLNLFNDPKNYQGEYINVVLGSGVISEGYTFKDIQHEHILTPYWNYSELDQIIARGWRLNSHNTLIKNNIKPVLKIYQYVSVPDDVKKSIDLNMYKISEIKDKNIKFVEYIIKKNTVDCKLFYNRNRVTDKTLDFSRECEYKSCDYKCDNFKISEEKIETLNTNYNLYYPKYEEIIKQIEILFKKKFSYHIDEIFSNLSSYTLFEIIASLNKIISENILLTNKYGFTCFLRENDNIFFIVDDITLNNTIQFSSFYTKNPKITHDISFISILKNINTMNIVKYIKSENLIQLKQNLLLLPIEKQQFILESAIISLLEKKIDNVNSRNFIINLYNPFLFIKSYDTFVNITIEDFNIENTTFICTINDKNIKCINNSISPFIWQSCPNDIIQEFNNFNTNNLERIYNNRYKHYGIIDIKTNEFFIKNTEKEEEDDKRKVNKGKRCINWKKHELVKLIMDYIHLPLPENNLSNDETTLRNKINNIKYIKNYLETKEESFYTIQNMKSVIFWYSNSVKNTCVQIKQWFENNNLIIKKL
jgi:hypothetical protein